MTRRKKRPRAAPLAYFVPREGVFFERGVWVTYRRGKPVPAEPAKEA